MTDYVAAYADPSHPYHGEAGRLAAQMRDHAHMSIDNQVARWVSNGSVIPADCAALAVAIGCDIDVERMDEVRRDEQRAFFAEYRARQPRRPSAEHVAAARAAHGEGVTLVDVISGRKFRT